MQTDDYGPCRLTCICITELVCNELAYGGVGFINRCSFYRYGGVLYNGFD